MKHPYKKTHTHNDNVCSITIYKLYKPSKWYKNNMISAQVKINANHFSIYLGLILPYLSQFVCINYKTQERLHQHKKY